MAAIDLICIADLHQQFFLWMQVSKDKESDRAIKRYDPEYSRLTSLTAYSDCALELPTCRTLNSNCFKSRIIVSRSKTWWGHIDLAHSLKGARSIPHRHESPCIWLREVLKVVDDGLGGLLRLFLEFV